MASPGGGHDMDRRAEPERIFAGADEDWIEGHGRGFLKIIRDNAKERREFAYTAPEVPKGNK